MFQKKLIDKISNSSLNYPDKTFTEKNKIYTCINPYKYHLFHKEPEPYLLMDGIFVDGIFMCKAINWFFGKNIPRLSFDMTSMAKDLFPHISKTGESIYFIGDKQDMIEKSVGQFHKSFPEMKIIGYRNGFFENEEERNETIRSIISKSPDFVVVGMGGKIQEMFLYDLKQNGFKGIGFTCGGFLHQAAQNLQYFPNWINKYNLRFPYRMIKERTYKRLIHTLGTFPLLFLYDSISSKHRRQ